MKFILPLLLRRKVIYGFSCITFVFFLCQSGFSQSLTFTWARATNGAPSDIFLFSMGSAAPFNYSTNWVVKTNQICIDRNLMTGAMNYFGVQEMASNATSNSLSGFSNWVAVRRTPAMSVWIVTSTNISGTWSPLSTNTAITVPMVAASQFFETAFTRTNIFMTVTN